MNAGHYIAVCKGEEGVWREFDDDAVRELTADEVVSDFKGAQTVFLKKRK